jgi:serine phosphatase RsbU (regulator of sigma subunit)
MLKSLKSLPIRTKLIGTTTLLLVFTVGLYGLMNVRDLITAYDESREDQQAIILQSVTGDARDVTRFLADSSAIHITASAYGDLRLLVERLAKTQERLVWVTVSEDGKEVHSFGSKNALLAGLTGKPAPGFEDGPAKVEVFTKDGEPQVIAVSTDFAVGEARGHVDVGWSIAEVIKDRNAVVARRVEERKAVSLKNTVFVGGLIVLLGIILAVLQSLRISRPIRELTESVERIAHGELAERAQVESTDEIGVLGRNINYMAERLGVLLTETKEKATLEKEMEVARIIQESLLPPSRLFDRGWMQFQGFFKSASICGGDWWSFYELSGGRLLIVIGDVTGHGVSSAMITAAAKSCCDTLRHVTDGELTVSFLLEELNKTIYEAANRKFVMTFFATIIDPAKREIVFGNAGHNFPLLFRAKAKDGEPDVVPLVTRGNRLGDVMDSRFLERTVTYDPGDVLVWYTDGITEGIGKSGEEYGERRFRRSIAAMRDKPADAILDRVLRDAESYFANFTQPEDDITLIVGKFGEQPAARPAASRSAANAEA